ncbi:MAG: hypothetical protein HC838_01405 [Spirulinaceae cyanobacterium RM2_2_10]|nr:hypothetical protein [Spirulinaceae cyanobacterium SM2_1_0]NJO18985.1 hypothetical protein [Spirulinaceae cyanobacterium RM2_2_10]
MNLGIFAALIYGLLALVGGIAGYAKAGSKASLISGSISGLLLMLAALAAWQGQAWGLGLAIGIAALLVAVFIARLVKTRKLMPASLMIAGGLVTLVLAIPAL